MHYVYILRSEKNHQRYIGFTSDLKRRFSEHNAGHSSHTAKFVPWTLEMYSAFSDKKKARDFEKYLKSGSGVAFAKRHF